MVDFDPATGALTQRGTFPNISPTYLAITPGGFLYTHEEVVEKDGPHMRAYRIDAGTAALKLIGTQPVPGGYPCQVAYSKKHRCILESCYETGAVVIYPIAADGSLLPPRQKLQHSGTSANPRRQERAHVHCVWVDDDRDRIVVADLGIDQVVTYRREADGYHKAGVVDFPAGSGPRHIAAHPDGSYLFVLSELTSTVMLLPYRDGRLTAGPLTGTVPDGFDKTPGGAAIRTSPDGRFVYVSERADSHLAILQFTEDPAGLTLVSRVPSGGRTPRDILFDPTGRWLVVANQDSDELTVFSVDAASGMITPSGNTLPLKSPACLAWMPVA